MRGIKIYKTKEAHRAANKRYRDKHKERLKLKQKEWLERNPEIRKQTTANYRAKVKPQMEEHRRNNFEWYIYNSLRSRARRLGYEFNLELSDIVIPEKCPYLDRNLTRLVGQGRSDWNPSVDRVDCAKGYIKGNIEIVSDKANRMKNNSTKEELVLFAKRVLERNE